MANYREIASFLKTKVPQDFSPKIGIVCGSGLSSLSDGMTEQVTIPYSSIPGFPQTSVAGHKGELVFGYLSGTPTVCLRGRFHSYEGHSHDICALPVRVFRCLGVKLAVITNAAGGLNPNYNVGDVAIVMDHLALPNLASKNCLVGPNDDELGPRFPPMSNAYDKELQEVVVKTAKELKFDFIRENGTYCFVSGPMYESAAESRFLQSIGGDTVGMSTIPEVVAAHHCGIQVLVMSLVTNKVVMPGDDGPAANHLEVLDAVNMRGDQIQKLVKETVANLSKKGGWLENRADLAVIDLSKKWKGGGGEGGGGMHGVPVKCAAYGVLIASAAFYLWARCAWMRRGQLTK
ncbi:hypothetical protein ScalyP_jg3444 [Parmales sp. scaly parma]|nr:hypothetical protein ScalyP_jg3444 [Parmales sp. scaly parma]